MSRNKDKEKAEICKARKDSGLNCNGCAYREECDEIKAAAAEPETEVTAETSAEELPDGMRPGTKQAKIYGLLKGGQTAKEIVATKEFAPESVYIVARKYFPDAISPNNKNVARVKKETAEKKMEERVEEKPKSTLADGVLRAIKEFLEPPTEINPKIARLEKTIKEEKNWKDAKLKTMKYLENVKTKLEEGELIEAYTMLQEIIEAYRKELEKEE